MIKSQDIVVLVKLLAYQTDKSWSQNKDRGNQDFLLSHDLEDNISVIDGRPEIANYLF